MSEANEIPVRYGRLSQRLNPVFLDIGAEGGSSPLVEEYIPLRLCDGIFECVDMVRYDGGPPADFSGRDVTLADGEQAYVVVERGTKRVTRIICGDRTYYPKGGRK